MKTFSILCFSSLVTGCSCNILSTSTACSGAMATGMIVAAPILLPYSGAKALAEGHKEKRTDNQLIEAVLANDRVSLELTLIDRISYKTPFEKRQEMKRLAAKKLLQYDDYSSVASNSAWNEMSLTAMIFAYRIEAYSQGMGSEGFERYMIRSWELYQMLKKSDLKYNQDAQEFLDIGQKYYLIKNRLLKQNSALDAALPIFSQCYTDPLWQDESEYYRRRAAYLNCKYALAYYTKKNFPETPAVTQPALAEIERQYKREFEPKQ